jgi:hypothetical protein
MSSMPGKLMVDVTTLIAESGRIAHGTTRVERGIVAALAKINPPGLAFCRFDGLRQRFVGVPGDEVAGVLARPARAEAARQAPRLEAASRLSSHGKRIERLIRDHVGRPARRRIAAAWRRIDRPHLPAATTLVSVGEIRFDLAVAGEVLARSDGAFVSTIFDVLPIGFAAKADPSMAERDMLALFDRLFRLSRMCLCISGATRRDVAKYAEIRGLACPPCEVIPLADDLPAAAVRSRPDVPVEPGAYVLSVGSITARKNQKLLVDIWRRFAARDRHPACKLVLVGGVDGDSHQLVRAITSEPGLAGRIVVLENADDRALAWLYANCRFSAFPSFLEGFGLPVAESLAAGKLCVASSSSGVPEAAQGQAILIAPDDAEVWATTISRLIESDEDIRAAEQRIAAGYRRRTWIDTASRILDILGRHALMPGRPGGSDA